MEDASRVVLGLAGGSVRGSGADIAGLWNCGAL